jgi:hypothetical protein
MTTQTGQSTRNYRYTLVHGDDADFIAYQRRRDDGGWQTFSEWMIPPVAGTPRRSRA